MLIRQQQHHEFSVRDAQSGEIQQHHEFSVRDAQSGEIPGKATERDAQSGEIPVLRARCSISSTMSSLSEMLSQERFLAMPQSEMLNQERFLPGP